MGAETRHGADQSRLEVDDALSHLIEIQRQTFSLLVERRAELRPDQPTRIQTHLLRLVHDAGPMSVSELARLLAVAVPTASQWVNRMADRGWLELVISDRDRRRHDVRITSNGSTILAERYRARLDTMRRILGMFTPEERATLVGLIERAVRIWCQMPHAEGSSHDDD